MKNKTLKEKIDRLFWWAFGLTVLYFVVGAFLKSDGPIFDPIKTYDLIKDTLTLTAAFLAPVAAIVLFSDWREQHRQVREESEVLQHLSKIKKDSLRLNQIFTEINNYFETSGIEIIQKFHTTLEDEIISNEKNENDLDSIILDSDHPDFYKKIRELVIEQGRLLRSIYILFRRKNKVEECKVSSYREVDLPNALKSEDEASMIFYERVNSYFESYEQKIRQINEASKPHKI